MLDIIIINWNSGALLDSCLQSLAGSKKNNINFKSVIIVDNASTGGTLVNIDKYEMPVQLISNSENVGFARACNQGAEAGSADFILFLNPDTFVEENTIGFSLQFMEEEENQSYGILGVQMVDDSGLVSKSCARFPTLGAFIIKIVGLDRIFPSWFPGYTMLEWDHAESRKVDHVIGAFYLVRRNLFEMNGGFDERFFMYLEDLDFSLSANQRGYSTYYLASVKVRHKGGGTSESIKAQRLFYALRSRLIYVLKHFKTPAVLVVILGTLFVEPAVRMIHALVNFSFQALGETASGFYLLWRDLPNIIISRNSGEAK